MLKSELALTKKRNQASVCTKKALSNSISDFGSPLKYGVGRANWSTLQNG